MEIEIAFNPNESKEPLIKEIFADHYARTLWLLWKRGHIVNQHFNKEVLNQAELIKKHYPNSDYKLFSCLARLSNFHCEDLYNFCHGGVVQYFTGNKKAEYKIVNPVDIF